MKLYKFLREDGTAPYSDAPWSLPTAEGPGDWMPWKPVRMCESGYHVTTLEHAVYWIDAACYEVEIRGVVEEGDTKICAAEARLIRRVTAWSERTARLFAADCAEHVLPILEAERPGDDRPRKAIQAARDFANGKISIAARDAAREAAWAAAWDAVRDAAREAETRWQAWRLAEYLLQEDK